MSTHLAELIFPSTSVIEPTSSLQILMAFTRIVAKKLTISLGKIEKIVCDGVEIDYTGHYKNNGIK
jgi:hypothetical protein